jgi:hypothetical protein
MPLVEQKSPNRSPLAALGMSLGLLFVILYCVCVLTYLVAPGIAEGHAMLSLLLPWFSLLTWRSFLIGLVESFAYGWFIAIVFAPLYNFFSVRWP